VAAVGAFTDSGTVKT
jgi:hypothetical protein